MKTELDHRDVRKVQFTGRSTYVLSLPKKWIEEMHVKAGDRVTLVRELDNSLSVIPIFTGVKESPNEVTTLVLPSESGNTLRRKVVSIYLAGYNIIHLRIKSGRMNPALRDAVRELVRRNLVGTEMIADASDNITLQVLLSSTRAFRQHCDKEDVSHCIVNAQRCYVGLCRAQLRVGKRGYPVRR